MYKIIDDRGTGKTSRLLLIAKETGATFVCSMPYIMREKAYKYGITGIDFISYKDFIENKDNYDKVVIDELEMLVRYIQPEADILACTISKMIKNNKRKKFDISFFFLYNNYI